MARLTCVDDGTGGSGDIEQRPDQLGDHRDSSNRQIGHDALCQRNTGPRTERSQAVHDEQLQTDLHRTTAQRRRLEEHDERALLALLHEHVDFKRDDDRPQFALRIRRAAERPTDAAKVPEAEVGHGSGVDAGDVSALAQFARRLAQQEQDDGERNDRADDDEPERLLEVRPRAGRADPEAVDEACHGERSTDRQFDDSQTQRATTRRVCVRDVARVTCAQRRNFYLIRKVKVGGGKKKKIFEIFLRRMVHFQPYSGKKIVVCSVLDNLCNIVSSGYFTA